MADNNEIKANTTSPFSVLATPEGFQKYILGTKKNGSPRAVYDIVTDYIPPKKSKKDKKKKNKKHTDTNSLYDLYTNKEKKKNKKGKKKKYWHI